MNSKQNDYRSISPEKAKELLKSGKARPAKGSGLIDIPSMLISFGVSVILFASVAIYFELFSDTRIIKDFVPEPINVELLQMVNSYASVIKELIEQQDFKQADSLLQFTAKTSDEWTSAHLYSGMISIELKLATHNYKQALELTRTIQSYIMEDKKALNTILWYRAHAYYYLKQFQLSHEQFTVIVLTGDERYISKAEEYKSAIYDLIRTDGLNVFFE